MIMKTAIARKPYTVELKPLAMLSAPSCGPMTRSSTPSIGADGAQEQCQFGGVFGRTHAGDLEGRTQLLQDVRHRQHFRLALFVQDDGHLLANALAGRFAHLAAAVAV